MSRATKAASPFHQLHVRLIPVCSRIAPDVLPLGSALATRCRGRSRGDERGEDVPRAHGASVPEPDRRGNLAGATPPGCGKAPLCPPCPSEPAPRPRRLAVRRVRRCRPASSRCWPGCVLLLRRHPARRRPLPCHHRHAGRPPALLGGRIATRRWPWTVSDEAGQPVAGASVRVFRDARRTGVLRGDRNTDGAGRATSPRCRAARSGSSATARASRDRRHGWCWRPGPARPPGAAQGAGARRGRRRRVRAPRRGGVDRGHHHRFPCPTPPSPPPMGRRGSIAWARRPTACAPGPRATTRSPAAASSPGRRRCASGWSARPRSP